MKKPGILGCASWDDSHTVCISFILRGKPYRIPGKRTVASTFCLFMHQHPGKIRPILGKTSRHIVFSKELSAGCFSHHYNRGYLLHPWQRLPVVRWVRATNAFLSVRFLNAYPSDIINCLRKCVSEKGSLFTGPYAPGIYLKRERTGQNFIRSVWAGNICISIQVACILFSFTNAVVYHLLFFF